MEKSELTVEPQELVHSFWKVIARTALIVQDRLQVFVEVLSSLDETV